MDYGFGFIFMPLLVLGAIAHWLFETIGALLPIIGIAIGVVAVAGAILSALVLIVPARRMARATRPWVRITGWVLGCLEVVATVAFAGIAIIAFAAVAIYA